MSDDQRDPKPISWDQFPNKIYMHRSPGEDAWHGPAKKDGDLQAEYVLNNVKRLRIPAPVLEDIE